MSSAYMEAAHDAYLPPQTRRVLLALCEVCDDLGLCDVSQNALACRLSMHRPSVIECLRRLESREYLRILKHPDRQSHMYRLLHKEREDGLTRQTKSVLLALRELCNAKGKCDVSLTHLACRLSMHRSTVDRSLKRLKRLGCIRIRKHPKKRRRYIYQLLRAGEATEKKKVEPMPSIFRFLYNFRPSKPHTASIHERL